jgi:hypothetical protein
MQYPLKSKPMIIPWLKTKRLSLFATNEMSDFIALAKYMSEPMVLKYLN